MSKDSENSLTQLLKNANLFLLDNQSDKAIKLYYQAIKLYPNFYWFYYKLGEALKQQGDLEKAITQYQKAIEKNPKSALCHYSLGELLESKGELSQALFFYKKVLDFNPTYLAALQRISKLECDTQANKFKKLRFDSILIVTYGRSGSTLLQGIFNSINGVLVRGENENFIIGLYEAFKRLKSAKEKYGLSKTKNVEESWYGAVFLDIDLFINYCQKLIKDLLLADHKSDPSIICYGFKEIRYFQVNDFQGYLDFLRKIFPNPCLIFNFRNLNDVTESGWWKNKDEKIIKEKLMSEELRMQSYAEKNYDISFQITYEDVISKSERLKSLFEFIGAEYIDLAIDRVLQTSHSSCNRSIKLSQDQRIKYCKPKNYRAYLADILIDHLPKKVTSNQSFSFQGVVIPINNEITIYSIKAYYSLGYIEAKLGLPSSHFGQKFRNINSSDRARFIFENLLVSSSETFTIVVEFYGGYTLHVASVHIEIES